MLDGSGAVVSLLPLLPGTPAMNTTPVFGCSLAPKENCTFVVSLALMPVSPVKVNSSPEAVASVLR